MTTNKTFTLLCALAIAIVLMASPASAQVNSMYSTTTSAAFSATDRFVCLSSATNIVLPSTTTQGSQLWIDHETDQVTGVTSFSSTCFNVTRKQFVNSHLSGAKVWFGPANWFGATDPVGGVGSACTLSSIYAYPLIVPTTKQIWYCLGGQWANGFQQGTSNVPYTFFSTLANPGNLIAPTLVTNTAGGEFFSQIYIPSNGTVTGACLLNGTTVATGSNSRIYVLWDAGGKVLANSVLTGTASANASTYQCVAFTATVAVTGGSSYYIGVQTQGTADTFYGYATGGAPTNYGTGTQTGTFGTVAAITTPPTTFTTAKGPMMMLY